MNTYTWFSHFKILKNGILEALQSSSEYEIQNILRSALKKSGFERKKCLVCEEHFYPERIKQVFCGKSCTNVYYMRKMRKLYPDVINKWRKENPERYKRHNLLVKGASA